MTRRRREQFTLAQARRVALVAQGFGAPRPSLTPDRRALRRVLKHTGLLQIDSVNVLARAHYLPLFSRLGCYPPALLERAAYGATKRQPRELFEYWGHEASLLPIHTHPLFRWRMAEVDQHAWGGMRRIARERPDLLARVLADVRRDGPLSAGELAAHHQAGPTRRKGTWWDWDEVKIALEYLFWAGEITTSSRRGFERLYDVPERVIPPEILELPTPSRQDAQRELVRRAARSLGVAAARDLRDYYRLPAVDAKARIVELCDAGELLPVTVEGWRTPAFASPEVTIPRRVGAAALLSPFDPVVWERDRTERLFGFRYRIEIYVPADKRVHGYYVLPFLLDDALVARVDLKADRQRGVLLVQSAWAEPSAPGQTAERLAEELHALASWLGLAGVEVREAGDLALELGRAVSSGAGR